MQRKSVAQVFWIYAELTVRRRRTFASRPIRLPDSKVREVCEFTSISQLNPASR